MRGLRSWVWLGVLAALGGAACSSDDSDPQGGPGGPCVGKCDGPTVNEFEHRWAIDIQKMRRVSTYRDVQRFTGVPAEQLLPPGAATMGGHPELEPVLADMRSRICAKDKIVGADGSVRDGECFVYGNQQTRNFDHSPHVDDPANRPIINYIDGEDRIDPPGYLNVIALLNAERHEQDEIRRYLRNGDVLLYIHPEDKDTTQSQAHHAAMYYDTGSGPLAISLNGVPFVHHIDNPDSYGPTFNAGPTSTPFHVYRFSPNGQPNTGLRNGDGRREFPCNDSIRGADGPAECQSGAATFTITNEMAAQYSYLARNWAFITNNVSPFSDFHTLTLTDVGDIDRFAGPALERIDIPNLYCAGLVYTNLNLAANRPLNATALGGLASSFSSIQVAFNDRYLSVGGQAGTARGPMTAADLGDTMNLPRMGQLIFEPITASGIIDDWLDRWFGPLPSQERAIVIQLAAPQLVRGFSSLDWQATKNPGDVPENVATPERIAEYAMAYGQRDVNPSVLENLKAQEREFVANRYVPPMIYQMVAGRDDGVLSYVGTVVHVDMLSPIGTNSGNTGTGMIREFFEGGPDTSQYPHFTVPNGGKHAQRIFNVLSGPMQVGLGSKVSVRVSAADINDVRGLLHPPGTFTALQSFYACDRDPECIGNAPGIPLPFDPAQGGGSAVWNDVSVTFELFKPRSEGGLGCTIETDGRRLCPGYDRATDAVVPGMIELSAAYGQWTVTVLDRGESTTGAEVRFCDACSTGGAHSNQWVLSIRNDDAAPVTPEPPPPVPTAMTLLDETRSVAEGAEDTFTFELPAGASKIRVEMTPSSGDPDLYLRVGSAPTQSDYECRPYAGAGEFESCEAASPSGTVHVMVRGYSAAEYRIVAIAE